MYSGFMGVASGCGLTHTCIYMYVYGCGQWVWSHTHVHVLEDVSCSTATDLSGRATILARLWGGMENEEGMICSILSHISSQVPQY